jgi:membrane protein DedA with SNARE-associated domain
MSEPNVTDFLLSAMTSYGPLALGVTLFFSSLTLPLPNSLLLIAAGAFARQGFMDWQLTSVLALLGVVLGDNGCYLFGRYAGAWMQRQVERFHATAWSAASDRFHRYGMFSIFLTRCLYTSLDIPMSLVAGTCRYDQRRFLVADVAGRATWILAYGGIGYLVGSQWQAAVQVVGQYRNQLAIATAVIIAVYFVIRRRRRIWGTSTSAPHVPTDITRSP